MWDGLCIQGLSWSYNNGFPCSANFLFIKNNNNNNRFPCYRKNLSHYRIFSSKLLIYFCFFLFILFFVWVHGSKLGASPILILNPCHLSGIFKLITYVPATSALPLILTFSWLQGLRKHYTISLFEFISASSPALNLLDESPLWSFCHQIKLEHLQTLVLFHLAFCSSPGFPTLVLVHLGGRILHSPFSSGSKESQCQDYSVLVLSWREDHLFVLIFIYIYIYIFILTIAIT